MKFFLHIFQFKIQDVISESSYLSGSCFNQLTNASAPPTEDKSSTIKNQMPHQTLSKPRQVNRDFVTPFLKDGVKPVKTNSTEIKPKHNPNAPTAVVMPRPPVHLIHVYLHTLYSCAFNLFYDNFNI